jgi:ribonucleoside-diphosphate reductase alpha chain
MDTAALDILAAETSASMAIQHPDFDTLAARIEMSNLHKMTPPSFSQAMQQLHAHGKVSDELVAQLCPELDDAIENDNDFNYNYMAIKTLQRGYLMPFERPQYMLMRVAIGIHGSDHKRVLQTYHSMSAQRFTHATPTLFNSGTSRPQLASCFLLTLHNNTISGIYKTLADCATISSHAGGIGLSIHGATASSKQSKGIIPMLRVFNETARHADQSGKRKGSFAVYLEPWHADIREFLLLKRNHGNSEHRARDLFYGMWIPDLFMQRVSDNGLWSLFCPSEAPGLDDCHSDEFVALYTQYEKQGIARSTVRAQELWRTMLTSQIETGTPYMLFKDACNRKSNQQHLGTIKSSNLCTEIVLYSSPTETAVCNLASVALSALVVDGKFDFAGLFDTVQMMTVNLNRTIDTSFYPTSEAQYSNMMHRPLGIGVQGLADVFMMLRLEFESEEAMELNVQIFRTMYYAACQQSMALAREQGPHTSYSGSPASKGRLQPDLWECVLPEALSWNPALTWSALRADIATHGLRNATLIAPMPTASTSTILGNTECIEPLTSNIYTRRVLSGEFIVVNKHLVKALEELGLWSTHTRNVIIRNSGSVQWMQNFPARTVFKTTWEIKQRAIMDLARARAPFICQHQSINIHMEKPTFGKLSSLHFYAWRQGMKGSSYYIRSKPAARAIQFTVTDTAETKTETETKTKTKTETETKPEVLTCTLDCENCSA